jgi:hypothetical protein
MTSQITKDFKMKSRLRALADGGSVSPSALGTGAAARAGSFLAGRGRQIDDAVDAATGNAPPAPAPAQQQQVAQLPKKSGLRGLLGFADGGSYNAQLRDGGHVKGPGGPTDDKVGPVMLSNKEYVLPGDTADAIGRDKLDAIRLATHDFKDGRKESALRKRFDGDGDEDGDGDGRRSGMMPKAHLADGGNPWIVDPDGNVRRPNAFGDAAAGPGYQQPRTPPPQPGTAVQVSRPPMSQRPPIDVTPPGSVSPPPAQVAEEVTDVTPKTGWTRAKGIGTSLLRNGAPMAIIDGSTQSLADNYTGYRDKFQNDMGAETPLGSVAADAARTLGEIGDAATFGLAGRLGRGIANVIGGGGGGGFVDGFLSPSDRDQYLEQRQQQQTNANASPAPAAATPQTQLSDQGSAQPVTPGSYQSRRLSEMGVPLDVQNSKPVDDSAAGGSRNFLRTGGTDQYQNLGTYGGNGNIYGKADDPSRPGRINNFVGVGAGASPSDGVGNTVQSPAMAAITSALRGSGNGQSTPSASSGGSNGNNNGGLYVLGGEDRYDKLAKELRGMYSAKGQGNLARRLLDLEQMRLNDQNNIRSNDTLRTNAQLSSNTSMRNTDVNAHTNMVDALARMETAHNTLTQQAKIAQLNALRQAMQFQRETENEGYDRYTKAIDQMFTTTENGKQVVDKNAAADFRAYIEGSEPDAGTKFAYMRPQEQTGWLQRFKTSFDMNNARNKAVNSNLFPSVSTGGVTHRIDLPTDVHKPTLDDFVNHGLSGLDFLKAKALGDNVVVTQSGQAVPFSPYVSEDGSWLGPRNLEKMKVVNDAVKAKQSALRNN